MITIIRTRFARPQDGAGGPIGAPEDATDGSRPDRLRIAIVVTRSATPRDAADRRETRVEDLSSEFFSSGSLFFGFLWAGIRVGGGWCGQAGRSAFDVRVGAICLALRSNGLVGGH